MYGTYCRLNISVGASDRELIRALWKRMSNDAKHHRLYRKARHKCYREMLRYHHNAQKLVRRFAL